jgi:uncharacterized protein with PIN domain
MAIAGGPLNPIAYPLANLTPRVDFSRELSLRFRLRRGVERLLETLGVEIVPFGEAEWPVAVDALRRYGRGHRAAALNFGDCLAYAAAVAAGDTLLFVGDHFAQTDIPPRDGRDLSRRFHGARQVRRR